MHGLPTHEVADLEDWFAHSFPVRTGTSRGLAVVYPWVDGLILNDPFAHGSLPRQHRGSALNQFRTLPVEHVLGVCDGCLMSGQDASWHPRSSVAARRSTSGPRRSRWAGWLGSCSVRKGPDRPDGVRAPERIILPETTYAGGAPLFQ